MGDRRSHGPTRTDRYEMPRNEIQCTIPCCTFKISSPDEPSGYSGSCSVDSVCVRTANPWLRAAPSESTSEAIASRGGDICQPGVSGVGSRLSGSGNTTAATGPNGSVTSAPRRCRSRTSEQRRRDHGQGGRPRPTSPDIQPHGYERVSHLWSSPPIPSFQWALLLVYSPQHRCRPRLQRPDIPTSTLSGAISVLP